MMRITIFLAAMIMAIPAALAEPAGSDTYKEAAEAVVADWTEDLGPAFRELALLPEQAFVPAWREEIDSWVARLDAAEAEFAAEPAVASRYEDRIKYEWAIGRLFYPGYHADLTDNPDFSPSAAYDDYLDEVDLARPDYLDMDEYTSLISMLRNRTADDLFDASLPGSVKYLTAKLMAAQDKDDAIRCWLDGEALGEWLEDNAADGLTNEVEAYRSRCPGDTADRVYALYSEELQAREGHPIAIYKTVDGHELELHIYPPQGWQQGDPLQPGVFWLHGGGWFFGSWSWCGPCAYFKDRGMAVAQVEYRTRGRFGTHMRDAYEDSADALAWLRENGSAYGVDPERVAVAGFSAGAHLSLALASLEGEGPAMPDMALSFSGCTDIVRDPYSVRMAGGEAEARALSPLFNVNPASTPIYMVNATEDTDCHFGSAKAFADEAAEAGVDVVFTGHEDAGHFFLRNPELSKQTREEVDAFLTERGF